MDQPEFDIDLPARKARPRREGMQAHKANDRKAPEWTRMKTVTRARCDSCVEAMVAGGKWKAPDPVVWRRVQGGKDMYLCWACAGPVRAGDGLVAFPKS